MSWNKKYYMNCAMIMLLLCCIFSAKAIVVIIQDTNLIAELNFSFTKSTHFSVTFLLDWKSYTFLSFVLWISFSVMIYSKSYMGEPWTSGRFILLVASFVLSMSLMVTSLNMVSILAGWDGLGLSSFLLVVYYQNEKSNAAGVITALTNRIGDVAILLSIGLLIECGTWNFLHFWLLPPQVAFLICIAAMTKSAQMPFSAWLPAAMAAPTPVSSLVHSSTLVTAGVYLLIRFESILSLSTKAMLFYISIITMFMSSVSANLEFDLKKIIALSTLSQLGVMISTLMLGFSTIAFFHLLTHAAFKAMLFLCAGKIIHNTGGSQDIRFMGNIMSYMPLTSSLMNLASVALIGFPFMAGFYSKDLLIEQNILSSPGEWTYLLFFISTGLSAAYSLRAIFYTQVSSPVNSISLPSEEKDMMLIAPIIALSWLAISSGCTLSWIMFQVPFTPNVSPMSKFTPILVTLMGFVVGFLLPQSNMNFKLNAVMSSFMSGMWLLPGLSSFGVTSPTMKMKMSMINTSELGWLEVISAQGTFNLMSNLSSIGGLIQLNNLKLSLKTILPLLLILLMSA